MLILQEESLPEETRVRGAKVLLAHDLLEDTTAELPIWTKNPKIEKLVSGLTFAKGEDKFLEVWKREEEVILLSFFDNVSNLMAAGKMKPGRRAEYLVGVRKHLDYVEKRYPKLEIVKIAKGLLG